MAARILHRVRFYDDTPGSMARWAAKHYRIRGLRIWYCHPGLIADPPIGPSSLGVTWFCDRRGPEIRLSNRCSHYKLIEVMAHELAHVVTWKRGEGRAHGLKFRKNLRKLIHEWNKYNQGEVTQ